MPPLMDIWQLEDQQSQLPPTPAHTIQSPYNTDDPPTRIMYTPAYIITNFDQNQSMGNEDQVAS